MTEVKTVESAPLVQKKYFASLRRSRRALVASIQFAILVTFLLGWQYLPTIHWLAVRFRFLDVYFVSSPSQIVERLIDICTGRNGSFVVWSYLWPTLYASLMGMVIGTLLGGLAGLILSNSPVLSAAMRPFLVAINTIPRVALIPIVIILLGPTVQASLALAVLVVFFVVFWNAYEGGLSIADQTIQNAMLLGANRRQVTIAIRLPYVCAWTFASVPNAVTFAFLSVVTTEVLSGVNGLGFLVTQAASTADATLTFAVVVILTIMGLAVVGLAQLVRKRALHWWHPTQT